MSTFSRKGLQIAIFGPAEGQGSWPRVTAGMIRGLKACDRFGGWIATDQIGNDLESPSQSLTADIAIHVGPPSDTAILWRMGDFKERWCLLAANSSWLPRSVLYNLENFGNVTGYVSPSRWSTEVIKAHTDKPVFLWQHGVEEGFRPVREEPPLGFKVLHLTSTFGQRKGTIPLIKAWCSLVEEGALPSDASLHVVADSGFGGFEYALKGFHASVAETVVVQDRISADVPSMAQLYRQFHFICQPSRAEGFGMVPLEARACGVPVIMTQCTGHAEHAKSCSQAGVCVVPHGPDDWIDDGPDAKAPSVEVRHICEALERAFLNHDLYSQEALDVAEQICRKWSWEKVTRDFLGAEAPSRSELACNSNG